MIMDIPQWYSMLNEKNISLIYTGPLWPEGIGGIAGTLKKSLEFDELPENIAQKIFSVFVEQMNNMLMYSAEKIKFEIADGINDEYSKGTFILGTLNEPQACSKENKTYFIQTGNVLKNGSIKLIKDRIDFLNTLDKSELRKHYRQQMKAQDNNPESRGAGLGFIEIARRISSKIEYSFMPYKEGLAFFTLYVTIERKGENDG
ncbi:MAG: SiaB family protein kinase [Treponema sp.]|nr:SiaB family protein kinase [Treponema sp.]